MTTRNEKSPLTRSASGQENGTAIEARGLSSAVNGTQTENLSARKSPAPEQASEATAARPGMESPTAEGIVDTHTAAGNETSSKVSRADALTDEHIVHAFDLSGVEFPRDRANVNRLIAAVRAILTTSPVEQPAAAPIDDLIHLTDEQIEKNRLAAREWWARRDAARRAPAPANERAAWDRTRHALAVAMVGFASRPELIRRNLDAAVSALDAITEAGSPLSWLRTARASSANETGAERAPRYAEWLHLRTHGEWSNGVPEWARDYTGRMNDFTAATAVIEELAAARASSANETGAEGAAVAWMRANDPRDCISDAKKRDMIEHAGAPGARLAENYSIALGVITPAQAMEPVAIRDPNYVGGVKLLRELPPQTKLYAAPQPNAQADDRVRLTDERAYRMYEAAMSAMEASGPYQTVEAATATVVRNLLAANPGEPEPRAEVTDDDIIAVCDAHGITLPVEALGAATALVNHFAARAGDATC